MMQNIAAKPIANALARMGIDNRKTYTLVIDNVLQFIPIKFKRDFLRGMFDGDGSICIYKYPYFKKYTYHIGYTGLKNVCDYVQEAFMQNTKMQDEGNGFYTVRSTCKADTVRIGHYLYDDATIYLDRKYNTFQEVYAHDRDGD